MGFEYSGMAPTGKGLMPVQGFQAIYIGTSQQVTITNANAQSSAVGARTSIVRLHSTDDCWIAIGANPTAVANGTSMFLKGGSTEYFAIQPGYEVAVIESAGGGTLYITEGGRA